MGLKSLPGVFFNTTTIETGCHTITCKDLYKINAALVKRSVITICFISCSRVGNCLVIEFIKCQLAFTQAKGDKYISCIDVYCSPHPSMRVSGM